MPREAPQPGYTPRELSRLWRVGEKKVRAWIASGELESVNVAADTSGKPQLIITAASVAEFERRRAGGPTPRPAPRRRRKPSGQIDFFPGD